MKKIFTLICALVGLAVSAKAATIDDVSVCKHSYVLVMDEWTNNGTVRPGKGNLFGDGYFLDVTGGSVATNKGSIDPAGTIPETGEYRYGEAFAKKYGEYGAHNNCLRLKKAQDVIAMKVTAGSKLIFLLNGNNKSGTAARIPKIATDAKLTNALNEAPDANFPTTDGYFYYEWTAPDDYTIYIGSYNGDMFVSYIIVEAKEAEGTPLVKVGPQTYDETKGLWYRDVTVKSVMVKSEDDPDNEYESIVTYTTDGSTPNATSEQVPADPIRCYKDMVLKFQAYGDFMGDGSLDEEFICPGAENEAVVSFSFDGPDIKSEKGVVTVTSKYEGQGATNFIEYGEQKVEGNTTTLTESAVVSAYTTIKNGDYATFTSKKTTVDVYILDPIKTTQEITISGNAVKDEEATAADPNGNIVYKVENGVVNADNKLFFVRNVTLKALSNLDPTVKKYQVPAGKEAYLQMNDDNITFLVAENDSVDVTVTCTKNSCKNLDKENEKKIYINVDGTTYGCDDITAGNPDNLDGYLNVVKFRLGAGYHTFKKYSGTGNIMVSSIKFEPVINAGISNVTVADTAKVKKVVENGQIVIVKGNNKYNVAGAQIK